MEQPAAGGRLLTLAFPFPRVLIDRVVRFAGGPRAVPCRALSIIKHHEYPADAWLSST
jgi:hypothetical protein